MLENVVKCGYKNKITKKVGEMKILNKISASVVALAAVSGVFAQAPVVHAVGGVYHWTGLLATIS